MEDYNKYMKPLFYTKYDKIIKIIINYCIEHSLLLTHDYILNKLYDGYERFDTESKPVIMCKNPFVVGNDIANLLDENGVDCNLLTTELNKFLVISLYDIKIPFLFIVKQYYNDVITVDCSINDTKYKICTLNYNIHIVEMFYILANIEYSDRWEITQHYLTNLLKEIQLPKLKNLQINTKSEPLDNQSNQIFKYINNNPNEFMAVGLYACNLIKKINHKGNYSFITSKKITDIVDDNHNIQHKVIPYILYDKGYFYTLIFITGKYKFYFYTILNFIPVKIHMTVSNIHVADINLLLCLLFNDLCFIKQEGNEMIINIIYDNIVYLLNLNRENTCHKLNGYLGYYLEYKTYIKSVYLDSKIHLTIYNPKKYKEENNHYRVIIES